MTSVTEDFLIAIWGLAAFFRVIWIIAFFVISFTRRRQVWWKQLLRDALLPIGARGSAEQAMQRYNLYFTHQVAAYTLGGLALAAWAILLSIHDVHDHFTLAMLGVTVVVAFGSSIMFRAAGGELTRMGYESGLAIASLSLVFAMASLLIRTFGSGWNWLVYAVGAVLVLRDVAETVQQMKLTELQIPRVDESADPEGTSTQTSSGGS
jgi:hypothetical protein